MNGGAVWPAHSCSTTNGSSSRRSFPIGCRQGPQLSEIVLMCMSVQHSGREWFPPKIVGQSSARRPMIMLHRRCAALHTDHASKMTCAVKGMRLWRMHSPAMPLSWQPMHLHPNLQRLRRARSIVRLWCRNWMLSWTKCHWRSSISLSMLAASGAWPLERAPRTIIQPRLNIIATHPSIWLFWDFPSRSFRPCRCKCFSALATKSSSSPRAGGPGVKTPRLLGYCLPF
jgi:hypothetical protein